MANMIPSGKHAVVELNKIQAVRTGEIIAQYTLKVDIDNGMLVTVDHIKKEIKLPTSASDPVYLVASEEKLYANTQGREDFYNSIRGFGVRLYKLVRDDIFETNAVDLGTYADVTALKTALGTKAVYGIPTTTGHIKVTETKTDTDTCLVALQIVELVTLPNGRQGVKFVVTKGM